jgi:hypothetical protein
MTKPKNVTNALWTKLSKEEQKRWIRLYKEIKTLSEYQNSTVAHNLAFTIIWLQEIWGDRDAKA